MVTKLMKSPKDLISNKQRIVITGCRQASRFASIIAQILEFNNRRFDVIHENEIVKYSADAPIALIVSSEKRDANGLANFRTYEHHIGVITEIEYSPGSDYNDEDDYIRQYDLFADATPKAGLLAYCEQDPVASVLCNKERPDVGYISYKPHSFVEESGFKYLINSHKDRFMINSTEPSDLKWFGGAKELLKRLGITSDQFYKAISSCNPA